MRISTKKNETGAVAHTGGPLYHAHFPPALASRQRRSGNGPTANFCGGFTMEEVVVTMAIFAITIGGLASGHVTSSKRGEWSAYSGAAQSAAVQQMEQVRAAKWDPLALPARDELVGANFPPTTVRLDLAGAGGAAAYATNRTTITILSANPPLKMIEVESTWSFQSRGPFTNSVTTYRSP